MISDDERRSEIAEKLRQAANIGGAKTLKSELAKALNINLKAYTPECSHGKIPRGLADLIDRPKYRAFIPNAMEGGVYCPQCGVKIDEYGVPNYCHNCGVAISL